MKIKDAVYEEVMVEQRREVSPEQYGCDECKILISNFPNEDNRLELTIFHNVKDNVEYLHFCSWDCLFKYMPKVETDDFVSLPFLYFDSTDNGLRSAKRFIELISKL